MTRLYVPAISFHGCQLNGVYLGTCQTGRWATIAGTRGVHSSTHCPTSRNIVTEYGLVVSLMKSLNSTRVSDKSSDKSSGNPFYYEKFNLPSFCKKKRVLNPTFWPSFDIVDEPSRPLWKICQSPRWNTWWNRVWYWKSCDHWYSAYHTKVHITVSQRGPHRLLKSGFLSF